MTWSQESRFHEFEAMAKQTKAARVRPAVRESASPLIFASYSGLAPDRDEPRPGIQSSS